MMKTLSKTDTAAFHHVGGSGDGFMSKSMFYKMEDVTSDINQQQQQQEQDAAELQHQLLQHKPDSLSLTSSIRLLHLTDIPEQEPSAIPPGNGLVLRLDHATCNVMVEYTTDGHFPEIHPNCYAPSSLTHVRLLHGGGSGTAVFCGHHPLLGKVIMKHAGPRDTEEVLSLARITQELMLRGRQHAPEAARFMQRRIPRFLFCYISPRHARDRELELWGTMRVQSWRELSLELKYYHAHDDRTLELSQSDDDDDDDDDDDSDDDNEEEDGSVGHKERLGDSIFQLMKTKLDKRDLWIQKAKTTKENNNTNHKVTLQVNAERVVLQIPNLRTQDCVVEDGYDFLNSFTHKLAVQQDRRAWKVTLAQSNVGGPSSENGATVLVSGRFKNAILTRTIRDFVQIMEYLRELSLPHERQGVIQKVRQEVQRLQQQQQQQQQQAPNRKPKVESVSRACNDFVGTAIRKNFLPVTGRFPKLREFGVAFASNKLFLEPDEQTPARFLGRLLPKPGCPMDSVFLEPPSLHCALDHIEDSWLDVLTLATSYDSRQVNDCIWTCGLTDAGLHNTFVDTNRGVELFDLGAPQLMPMPAFLTKFLMSFFHTLGMEEDTSGKSWVCRFEVVAKNHNDPMRFFNLNNNNKQHLLSLTRRTKSLMPYIQDNFSYTMNHLISQVFEGNERVRELLLTYTILQLVSDASFCLERWGQKGGGRDRINDRNTAMGKWLWRCLWDLYISSHVYETLLVPIKMQHHHKQQQQQQSSK